jgi:excisionase family DNA binding protein
MAIDLRKIDPDLSYPLRQVAEFLDVSYGTVLRLKNDSRLRPIKIGRRYYIQGKKILEYIRKG